MGKYKYMAAHMRGFTEEDMRGVFEGAGLENVAFERFAYAKKEGRDVQFFLAMGMKPASELKSPSIVVYGICRHEEVAFGSIPF